MLVRCAFVFTAAVQNFSEAGHKLSYFPVVVCSRNNKCCGCCIKQCILSFFCSLVALVIRPERLNQVGLGAYSPDDFEVIEYERP